MPAVRREARVYIAHAKEDQPCLHTHGDETVIWRSHHQAARDVAHLAIPELERFIQGYIEGWIPSGWINLIPQP